MKKRPRIITVICWILLITSGITLTMTTAGMNAPAVREHMAKSSIPMGIQLVLIYLGMLVTIVCSFAMLKGKGWARLLYIAWSALGFALSLSTSPVTGGTIAGILIFVIIAFFLFRPEANAYFGSGKKGE